jgi:hypothetical protein
MAHQAELIIQIPRGSSIDVHLGEEPPAGLADGRVVLEHLAADGSGRLLPPEAGEVVATVSSPEGLRREAAEIRQAISAVAGDGDPLIVLVEGAEYLRDDELESVLDTAAQTDRLVILRILEGV